MIQILFVCFYIISAFFYAIPHTDEIIIESYASIITDCYKKLQSLDPLNCEPTVKSNNQSYAVAGSFQIVQGKPQVRIDQSYDLETQYYILKHELVHAKQFEQRRIFECDKITLRFGNEIEANIAEYIPDKIYKLIY